jgi:hypothetical protein
MRRSLFALSLTIIMATPASAQDTTDVQFWWLNLATVRVSENWRLHLEEQPRWFNDVSDAFQILTRTGVGRRINDRLTLWGGYAWIAKPPGPGVQHEHRLWQQASVTLPTAARWTPSLRFRLEQRFQGEWADSSHRLRMLARGVRPIDRDGGWSIVGYDELFVTFDETASGPVQGYDQNRLFAGLLRRVNAHVSVEVGYLWINTERGTTPSLNAHAPFVWLNLAF